MSASFKQTPQQGNGGNYVTTQDVAYNTNITAGSQLLLIFGCGDGDYPDIKDNNGNIWHLAKEQTLSGQRKVGFYYVYNANVGATTVTLKTWQDAGHTIDSYSDRCYFLFEITGVPTTDMFDKSAGGTTSAGTTWASGNSSSTTQATEIIFGAVCATESTVSPGTLVYTGDAGYNTVVAQPGYDQYTSLAYQYKTVSSTGVQSITMTTNNTKSGSIALVTFKDTPPASTNSNFLAFL